MLALQVVGGRPQFLYEGPFGRVKVEVESRVDDGEWHALHLRLHAEVTFGLPCVCGGGGICICQPSMAWCVHARVSIFLDSLLFKNLQISTTPPIPDPEPFQGVTLMLDLCGRGWEDSAAQDDSHCAARASWSVEGPLSAWAPSDPLQVGGMAHASPRPHAHGWNETPIDEPLRGCVSHVAANGEVGRGGGVVVTIR